MLLRMGMRGEGRITPREGVERAADPVVRRRNLRRVLGLFRPYRMRLLWLVVMIVGSAALGTIPAFLTRDLIDNVLSHPDNLNTRRLDLLVAGMVAITIVTGVIGVAQTWSSNKIGQHVMHDLRVS